jgi:hypothetical protein
MAQPLFSEIGNTALVAGVIYEIEDFGAPLAILSLSRVAHQ